MNNKQLGENFKKMQEILGISAIGDDNNEEINKKAFREWMTKQVKLKGDSDVGKPYDSDIIDLYVSNIENTPCPFESSKSLFHTTDKDLVVHCVKQFESSEDKNDTQRDAVKKYLQFVEGNVSATIIYETGLSSKFDHNRIIFGAPGTGKSFTLNKEMVELLGDDFNNCYERVTFHPDYLYANFVGSYKPTMIIKEKSGIVGDKADILEVLMDKNKTAQEKYDLLYDRFNGDGLTRLPVLLGLYTDENFKTKKQDGTDTVGDNSVERNHGRAIRPYVKLFSDSTGSKEIAYEYVPGPFMRILVKALKSAMSSSPKKHLLIVEEINRANVAAVFGDVFQLLDRSTKNISEYEISTTSDMRTYLATELGVDESQVETIKIPDNLYIWATMNSADQGVFPMDTAFKRRWDFTYLGINDAEDSMADNIKNKHFVFGSGDDARLVTWNEIRRAINEELSSEIYNINEDKLLGPYFIAKSVLEGSDKEFLKVFKNKVLMYLFEDAIRQKKKTFFENCKQSSKGIRYSDICKLFDIKGVFIFPDSVSEQFTMRPSKEENT